MFGKTQTLQQLNENTEFPFVVKASYDSGSCVYDHGLDISADTVIFIESRKTVSFAVIKALDFPEVELATYEKDDEFLSERQLLVGEEFLIPAEYQGKFKSVPRPGARTRYVTISQVNAAEFCCCFSFLPLK